MNKIAYLSSVGLKYLLCVILSNIKKHFFVLFFLVEKIIQSVLNHLNSFTDLIVLKHFEKICDGIRLNNWSSKFIISVQQTEVLI